MSLSKTLGPMLGMIPGVDKQTKATIKAIIEGLDGSDNVPRDLHLTLGLEEQKAKALTKMSHLLEGEETTIGLYSFTPDGVSVSTAIAAFTADGHLSRTLYVFPNERMFLDMLYSSAKKEVAE